MPIAFGNEHLKIESFPKPMKMIRRIAAMMIMTQTLTSTLVLAWFLRALFPRRCVRRRRFRKRCSVCRVKKVREKFLELL